MFSDSNSFDKYGFKRTDLERIFGEKFFQNLYKNKNDGIAEGTVTHHQHISRQSNPTEWEPRFANRTIALEIISALAILVVSKTGQKYKHGENISAKALAEAVDGELCRLRGEEKPKDGREADQRFRKLISEAIKEVKIGD